LALRGGKPGSGALAQDVALELCDDVGENAEQFA
jgi:hypothetical protein